MRFVYICALLLTLATATFSLMLYLKVRVKKEKTAREQNFFKNKRFFQRLRQTPMSQRIDKYLKEAGYPYGIVPESYFLLHFITVVTVVLLYLQNRDNGQGMTVLLMVLVPFNTLVYYHYRQRREKLQVELCNIQDIIYFQSKIGTPQDVILAYAAKSVGEPLKAPLQTLAEKYRMNKDLGKALEEFRETTDLMEFQAFTFILEQKEKTGFSEENHHAQATMLKRAKRMKRRIRRAYKRTKLIVASILLFACYILFATVPLLKGVFQSVDMIFR